MVNFMQASRNSHGVHFFAVAKQSTSWVYLQITHYKLRLLRRRLF